MALARAGDSAGAQAVADNVAKSFQLHRLVLGDWLPAIRAAIEISRGNPARAIEVLQVTSRVDPNQLLGDHRRAILYASYLRGLAYLLQNQGGEAGREFQKILDQRRFQAYEPEAALARLGLARAYALKGDRGRAQAKYQDFLTLWKDADPDIPILKEAKAEYAKLQ